MASFPSTHSFVNPQPHQVGYQTIVDGSGQEGSVTLLIIHLPEAIPPETLSRLISHYGASAVRPVTNGMLKNCAFVDFKNEVVASQAQRQFHVLRFLGKVLSVERAKKQEDNSTQAAGGQIRKDAVSSQSLAKETSTSIDNSDSSKLKIFPAGELIAPRLSIEYPFPPHLEYAYPHPDGNILTNIVNVLIAVPRFYTQNYSAGNPAPVLYMKNLSKDVVYDDFYFTFGSLFGDLEMAESSLTVKLMQNLANGYVFKGKPMIIQFGRNPAATRNG